MNATPQAPVNRARNQVLFWLGLVAALFLVVWLFRDILLPFVLGAIIAYMLDPAVRRLGRKHIPRWAAAMLILGAFILFVVSLVALLTPLAYREGVQLIRDWINAQPGSCGSAAGES